MPTSSCWDRGAQLNNFGSIQPVTQTIGVVAIGDNSVLRNFGTLDRRNAAPCRMECREDGARRRSSAPKRAPDPKAKPAGRWTRTG
ncbi:hypothetical protein WKW79_34155 [Variovorax robiniae]|uniref:Uncharacterized protein n=1 Tax=Variovorax robiniae TaxID=1836199 RepID=A0ABU8XIF9_9BURK